MLVLIPVLHGLADEFALRLAEQGWTSPDVTKRRNHTVFAVEVSDDQSAMNAALDSGALIHLVAECVNLPLIRHARQCGNPLPRLSDGYVWFEAEPWEGSFEEFAPLDVVLSRGRADCDDIVAWRLADLWDRGETTAHSAGYCRWVGGERHFHGQIRRGNGLIEDPSRNLGM